MRSVCDIEGNCLRIDLDALRHQEEVVEDMLIGDADNGHDGEMVDWQDLLTKLPVDMCEGAEPEAVFFCATCELDGGFWVHYAVHKIAELCREYCQRLVD